MIRQKIIPLTLLLFLTFIFCLPLKLRSQGIDSTQWARKQIFAAPSKTFIPHGNESVKFVDVITKPVINILINGKGPFRMLIDVGANITLLQKNLVKQLGLRNLRPNGGKLLLVDSIKIGNASFTGIVAGEDEWKENIDGVIGFNIFKNCLLSFDYTQQRLNLLAGELPAPDNKTIFRYTNHLGLPYYTLSVGADTLEVLLDTGMSGYFAINSKYKDRFKFSGHEKNVTTTSSYYKGSATLLPLLDKIKIGRYAFNNCPTVISVEDGNRLGSGIFQYFTLTFDQKNNTFRITGDKSNFEL